MNLEMILHIYFSNLIKNFFKTYFAVSDFLVGVHVLFNCLNQALNILTTLYEESKEHFSVFVRLLSLERKNKE